MQMSKSLNSVSLERGQAHLSSVGASASTCDQTQRLRWELCHPAAGQAQGCPALPVPSRLCLLPARGGRPKATLTLGHPPLCFQSMTPTPTNTAGGPARSPGGEGQIQAPSPHTEQVPPRCTMKDPRVRGAARLMIYDWVSGTEAPCVLDMLRQQAARAALKARGSWRNRRRPHKATLPRRRVLLPHG